MKINRFIITNTYQAPCGELIIGSIDGRLCLCDWLKSAHRRTVDNRIQRGLSARYYPGETDIITETKRQLDEYFDGKRKSFDLEIMHVGTEVQRKVWDFITGIPYGSTESYSGLTAMAARDADLRAVSNAVAANALSLIIPCHRVIGSRGKLTGYAGGLLAKQYLLDLEKTYLSLGIFDAGPQA